ncbi:Aste57867_8231 [Aphanomyces stellatus]|uniref:Aste57867_8231 protein n=1 Tax=Aphanomyces stellatus TaxID=120398 RepID=A0A485KJN9_9STRA|nr:hypothetical protein As57867_008200 [Aphanomyces stellatus]VFT85118.1 Aste57867_8231 [Aphanomyces stellatus]
MKLTSSKTNAAAKTTIFLTQANVGAATVARLQVDTHRIPKSKRGKCFQCQSRLLFFWKKRNCHMCGEVVCSACRTLVVIERPSRRRTPLPTIQAKVCAHCVDAHFSKPVEPVTPAASKKPAASRSATKIWLQNLVSSKAAQQRQESRRSGRASLHRSSIHRPVRKHAFDSPRARRTSRHSQRLFMPSNTKKKWTNPWAPPPDLPDEKERLRSLRRFHILDTENEDVCDIVCELAASTYKCPVAGVAFMDKDRQWLKARKGLKQDEIPRKVALCAHAMASADGAPMVVLNTDRDPRFSKNPLVTGQAQFKFYMSVPFVTPLGHVLGTVFVADTKPRTGADPRDLAKFAQAILQFLMDRPTEDGPEEVDDDDDESSSHSDEWRQSSIVDV